MPLPLPTSIDVGSPLETPSSTPRLQGRGEALSKRSLRAAGELAMHAGVTIVLLILIKIVRVVLDMLWATPLIFLRGTPYPLPIAWLLDVGDATVLGLLFVCGTVSFAATLLGWRQ